MPIVLALLLAAKAARSAHCKDDDDVDSNEKQADSNNNNYSSSTDKLLMSNSSSKKQYPSRMEKRGAYLLDVKNGRLSLPPEQCVNNNDYRSTNSSKVDISGDIDRDPNAPLTSHEMTTTLMGTSTVVDLDDTLPEDEGDVDTSLETVAINIASNSDYVVQRNSNSAAANAIESTFRNDVRNEWIDAMFGDHFFPLQANGNDNEQWKDVKIRQGTGRAGVGTWVCYGAKLDPSNTDNSSDNSERDDNYERSDSSKSNETPRRNSALASLLQTKSTPLTVSRSIVSKSSSFSFLNTHKSLDDRDTNCSINNTTTIPTRKQTKIGATITRLPLGLYVKSICIHSEAYSAGISPGSILLDVNGIGLLGESSHRALERLWGYSGYFDTVTSTTTTTTTTANGKSKNGSLQTTQPIHLRFYKNKQIYTTLLLSSNPLKSIEWAPCGNFGLVQRVHPNGLASRSGVRRGCLLLGVNGVGCRVLDHAGVARELVLQLNDVEGKKSVILTCGYTPAASRSGYFEESGEKSNNGGGGSKGSTNVYEVRSRPVEYSTALTETFFACTAPSLALVDADTRAKEEVVSTSTMNNSMKSHNNGVGEKSRMESLELMAAYVAGGGVLSSSDVSAVASEIILGMNESSSSQQRRRRHVANHGNIGPCPIIESESLLDAWDPFTSLTRSMLYKAWGCCETSYVEMGGPFRVSWENDSFGEEAPHSISDCIHAISGIAQHSPPGVVERVFDGHLMQLLGVATHALLDAGNNEQSEKMLDILVDVALNDIDLCQRLFFLLRCFIGVLDGQVSDESAKSLKLLRYAQRRLSGRMFDESESLDASHHCSKGYPMSRENSSTSSFSRKVTQLDIALSESSLENNHVITPGAPANRQRATFPSQEANGTAPSLRLQNSDSGDCLSTDNLSCQTPASTITVNSNDAKKKNKVKSSSSKIRQLLKGGKSKSSAKKSSDNSQLPPITRTLKHGSTFSFTNVFHKQSSLLHTIGDSASPSSFPQVPTSMSMSQKFENLIWILRRIDTTCSEIEKKLVKSFPQKMADLALRPWTASKESALASITQNFQAELRRMNSESDSHFPILNPVHSSEQLTSVDADECYILPSAHFPMLLCFNTCTTPSSPRSSRLTSSENQRFKTLYRTKVEILGLRNTGHKSHGSGEAFIVHGAIGGVVQESGASEHYVNQSQRQVMSHRWTKGNILTFESSSNSHPKTLSLKISTSRNVDTRDDINIIDDDMGCAFVDLTPAWKHVNRSSTHSSISTSARVFLFDESEEFQMFDQHGRIAMESSDKEERVEIQCKISVEVVLPEMHPQKSLLLYKHGDDLRQELLAIQFIEMCNDMLKASGLDLKLKTFRCLPVGAKKGFIEWVSGTVPLSQLCQSTSCSSGSNVGSRQSSISRDSLDDSRHSLHDPTETAFSISTQSKGRGWCKYQFIRGLGQKSKRSATISDNPIQDYLRSLAYDENAPYFIHKDVMDTYVKSCAGYCVITYLLGVGDRHLDNILLHQNGHLIHCDFSFILGHDPKTYLPMRITDEMVQGFGGQESDNYAKFLSFIGAAFLTLRRHQNINTLLSQIRNMIYSNMRDLSLAQPPIDVILAMRDRFQVNLNEDDALTYIEHVVEKSITSKMWRAVDVMHSLGKRF